MHVLHALSLYMQISRKTSVQIDESCKVPSHGAHTNTYSKFGKIYNMADYKNKWLYESYGEVLMALAHESWQTKRMRTNMGK